MTAPMPYEVVAPDHARRLHWSWRCLTEPCSWVGLDCISRGAAEREASRHVLAFHEATTYDLS